MLKIGCHLSSSKGYLAMGRQAVEIGANTFQCFTRNPRGSAAKALNLDDIKAYLEFAIANNLQPLLAHAPYTMNPCSANPDTREFAMQIMADDLARLEHIPGSLYNLHPGGHGGQGAKAGIKQLVQALNGVMQAKQTTTVLLETMVGRGSELGGKFEELQQVIERVEQGEHIGVCLDTCHIFAGGYDIVDDLDGVLATFDTFIGLERLKAVHLNDSLHPLGSGKDRHTQIGKGFIGLEAIGRIINHPALRRLPFYLETPNDIDGYAQEIALLRSMFL